MLYVSWLKLATAEHFQTYSEDLWPSQWDTKRCKNAIVHYQAMQ